MFGTFQVRVDYEQVINLFRRGQEVRQSGRHEFVNSVSFFSQRLQARVPSSTSSTTLPRIKLHHRFHQYHRVTFGRFSFQHQSLSSEQSGCAPDSELLVSKAQEPSVHRPIIWLQKSILNYLIPLLYTIGHRKIFPYGLEY